MNSRPARPTWTKATTLMFLAVVLAGMAASVTVSQVFFLTTVLVVGILTRAARAEAAAIAPPAAKSEFVDFPDDLRPVVARAMSALPDGDARRLLLGVIVQARPILASRSTTFDPAAESASRTNVEALVAACCGTAIDLARLDAASSTKRSTPSDSTLDARFASARDMLVKRMSDATAALTALYAAGLEHGTPASNRVAELASEVGADAKARGAAATEIAELLGNG
ncbi:MAG TPA: hypothetical protein VGQ44_07880 [Gemmatimonadaceae bacterium]|nr:hypothetical protein [Gemmatimonadaceae bacterium]